MKTLKVFLCCYDGRRRVGPGDGDSADPPLETAVIRQRPNFQNHCGRHQTAVTFSVLWAFPIAGTLGIFLPTRAIGEKLAAVEEGKDLLAWAPMPRQRPSSLGGKCPEI